MRRETLEERVRRVIAADPSRGAIEYNGTWSQWGDVASLMADLDTRLTCAGLGAGTPVGMLLRNHPAHLAALLEVLVSGRCVVTINPMQSPERLAEEMAELRCPAYLADAQDWESAPVRDAARESGSLGLASGSRRSNGGELAITAVEGLEAVGTGPHHERLPGTGVLMLTSGTTGPPKRVGLAYRNFEAALLDALFYEGGGRQDGKTELRHSVVLAVLPLVHIGGVWSVVSAVVSGRSMVLFEKFDVERWRDAVRQYRPKVAALPPAAIRMIYDAGVSREDLASLLAIRSGAAPLDPDLQQAFESRYGIPVLNAYGATEFAGGVAGWTLGDHRKYAASKRGSVGRAQPGCEVRVVDQETFSVLPVGQTGLLEVRARHIGDGGWLRTTDLAEIDTDGFLYIRGRADDTIVRGGFKIQPADVAKVFLRHPSVQDAIVVGLPDGRLGAVPAAAVELRENASRPTEGELLALARDHLVNYQVPVRVKVVDALPRTPSMKVSQPAVRALFGVA